MVNRGERSLIRECMTEAYFCVFDHLFFVVVVSVFYVLFSVLSFGDE